MYRVHVHYFDEPLPREQRTLQSGTEVLKLIPELLAQHAQCEKIAVYSGQTLLFAVDCKGTRVSP